MSQTSNVDPERAVRERYAAGAQQREEALCCPVSYDPQYLRAIPQEILERDYGCGDPSRYLRPGERVLDLGSGSGKICYIASQIVGREGHVIGVDTNDEMLALARHHRSAIGERIGWHNVEFRRGRIQDLALDLDLVEGWLREHPVRSVADYQALEEHCRALRDTRPLIPSGSIDVVVSNCVLNLVRDEDKTTLLKEIHRVLKRGGRAAISDIVSDEDVPPHLKADPELWSGCVSGAMREDRFLKAFEDAGFYGVTLDKFDSKPWRTVEGIEFRAVTVLAYRGKEGECLERRQAVIYKGPFQKVTDDDGHVLRRGERTAVCEKTFEIYRREPYAGMFEHIEPLTPVPVEEAQPFDCRRTARRDPRETKGQDYSATTEASNCCEPGSDGGSCC
ncbi:MAG TPA: methyltransferase domain-containing protein [Polyangia bacterium]|jgi:ubiquinone/menaquinone biosynthesis C-methylase UbiE|nr:methyltransferase domain-containing protein [Polyangia bacterium]